jgi:RNA polymerase sigma factor (TIGR02999 family)
VTSGAGDPRAAAELLPIVYEELRRLAAARLARDGAACSLEPTALVHEAYLRLLGPAGTREISCNGRGHFFAAAAVAMRRILVERAFHRAAGRRALEHAATALPDTGIGGLSESEVLDLDQALNEMEQAHPRRFRVVMARFFAGLSVEDAAKALEISEPTVKRDWNFARVWLLERLDGDHTSAG